MLYTAFSCQISYKSSAVCSVLCIIIIYYCNICVTVDLTNRQILSCSDKSTIVRSAQCYITFNHRYIRNLRAGCPSCKNRIVILCPGNLRISNLDFVKYRSSVIISSDCSVITGSRNCNIFQIQIFKYCMVRTFCNCSVLGILIGYLDILHC